jgi:hypothetical protein
VQLPPKARLGPGVNVMITIFVNFANFRRKNWRFS